jgi:hypothetical protein
MCDYSLESLARRDAKIGDQLKTAKIGTHGTVGLVAPDSAETAVCLRPGTRLIVSGIPASLQKAWRVGEVAVATFLKRDTIGMWSRGGYHRDGVKFDGSRDQMILFQEFPPGMEVSVETVPGETAEIVREKAPATQPAEQPLLV